MECRRIRNRCHYCCQYWYRPSYTQSDSHSRIVTTHAFFVQQQSNKASINKLNAYPQWTQNISMLSATAKKYICHSAASPSKRNSQQKNDAEINKPKNPTGFLFLNNYQHSDRVLACSQQYCLSVLFRH